MWSRGQGVATAFFFLSFWQFLLIPMHRTKGEALLGHSLPVVFFRIRVSSMAGRIVVGNQMGIPRRMACLYTIMINIRIGSDEQGS
jgi:hypothetical protein